MKNYHNTRSSRRSVKNIQIIQGGQDLTAQAGLIPVVKFLKKYGFASKIEQTLDHKRGATRVYDAVDMTLFPLVVIVGGTRSKSSIVTVWNDHVMMLIPRLKHYTAIRKAHLWNIILINAVLLRIIRS